jgi:hypothetical protein
MIAALAAALMAPLVAPRDAAAQGRGRPKRPKTTVSSPSAPETPAPAVSFREFGSWLDDASAPTEGEGRTGIGFGYVRADGGSQFSLPSIDIGYGLSNRVQVGATVPFYHSSYAGTTARGLDDVYLSAKFTAIDPASNSRRMGLSVSPLVEVLSAGSVDGRLHWALPVSMEVRRDKFRVYGSSGYFSRGALFTAGAVESAIGERIAVTGALTQSYSTKEDLVSDAAGISRYRVDATGAWPRVEHHFRSAAGSASRSRAPKRSAVANQWSVVSRPSRPQTTLTRTTG